MSQSLLQNKKILITAGPTREAIDPVRYISNHSSGKMGYAIAESFLACGAQVCLISGPANIRIPARPALTIIHVNSAIEMYIACCQYFEKTDIAVFVAAVADYRPAQIAQQKIKKDESSFILKMVKNIDIAAEFGKIKTASQISVGFALETNDEWKNAIEKLSGKNFDMVVLNSMNDPDATFGHDTNKVSIIHKDLQRNDYRLKTKSEVADDIVSEIESIVRKSKTVYSKRDSLVI